MNILNGKNGVCLAAGAFHLLHLENIQRRLDQFRANPSPPLKPFSKQVDTPVDPICLNHGQESQ